jgi:hypothetical protein
LDIQAASSQGRLSQFFNSADNASAITKHLTSLGHIISELTVPKLAVCVKKDRTLCSLCTDQLITSSNTYQEATKANAGIRDVQREVQVGCLDVR